MIIPCPPLAYRPGPFATHRIFRPNLVHLNEAALLSNAELKPHDKITMGRTMLLFVPLCGPEFDWSDLQMAK